MLKQLCVIFAVLALAHAASVQETFKALPCLGKHAGDRLAHPTDPHKFLRCVEADSAWIETCPDKLFYNPHSQICDWDTLEKATTTTVTPIERDHAVLVKFRPVDGGMLGRSTGLEATVIQESDLSSTHPGRLLTLDSVKPVVPVVSSTTSVVASSGLEVVSVTPKAEFVFPATTVAVVASGSLEVLASATPKAQFEIVTPTSVVAAPIVPVVVPVTVAMPVTTHSVPVVESTTVVTPLVAQSIDSQSIVQKELLQQRIMELQQELMSVQQRAGVVVATTTPVARFNF